MTTPVRWRCRICHTGGGDPQVPPSCPTCHNMTVADLAQPYTCPACGHQARSPAHIAEGFCSRCADWTWQRLDDRLLRPAVFAAESWYLRSAGTAMTVPERTAGLVQSAIRYLIDTGLLTVPEDLESRIAVLAFSPPYTSRGPETRKAAPPPDSGDGA